jgi:nicotinamide-nucleotide amidase
MTGTELLLGDLVDTNACRIAKALREIGLDLYYKTTVGDNEQRITDVLNAALNRSEVVITSGGIGPTVDDVTRQAVANATGRKLVYSKELEEQIAERFRSFGRPMAENNKRQAYIPEGAIPLTNPVGTAPCFLSEDVRGRGFVISLPGVPRELDYMMEHTVIPLLVRRMGGAKTIKVRVLRTCAVGESNIDRLIGDLMTWPNPTVGLCAHPGQTDVRVAAKADTEAEADAFIAPVEATLRERLGVAIYGVDKETVPEVVGRLLTGDALKLGVVDTLTRGRLAHALIDAGFGHRLATNPYPGNLAEALAACGLDSAPPTDEPGRIALAAALARHVAPDSGVGLAFIGPFDEGSTFVAVQGPGDASLAEKGRKYQDSDHIRQWLVIQGLDRVRRLLLGQRTSPAD